MHIAATNPQSVSTKDLDQSLVEHERTVLTDQAAGSGKPAEIIAKMVEGRIRKFYQEVVLLEQVFVIDGENQVGKAVEKAAKDAGAPIAVKIGRASCRESVCPYVLVSLVAVSLKKKT